MLRLLFLLLLVVCPSFAGEQEELEKVMYKYQKLFHMENFHLTLHLDTVENIRTRIGNNPDGTPSRAVAMSTWYIYPDGTKQGELWVMKLSEYTPDFWRSVDRHPQSMSIAQLDQKDSVVHELLHCLIGYYNIEFSISTIASVIITK